MIDRFESITIQRKTNIVVVFHLSELIGRAEMEEEEETANNLYFSCLLFVIIWE